jgi:toxin FitB
VIILDTNVISETTRPTPSPAVLHWLAQHLNECMVSIVTVQELEFGAQRMPEGARRRDVESAITELIRRFEGSFVPLSLESARMTGAVLAARLAVGRATSVVDAQIAGTALVYGAAVATRNSADFEGLGIELINPWQEPDR